MNIVLTYLALVVLLLIETVVFLWQDSLLGSDGSAPVTQGLWLSLPNLLRIAAYVMALPLALQFIYTWIKGNWYSFAMRFYLYLGGFLTFVLWLYNLEVFGFREFHIAGSETWQILAGIPHSIAQTTFVKGAVVLVLLYFLMHALVWMVGRLYKFGKYDPAIFIPIRPSAAVRIAYSLLIIVTAVCGNMLVHGDMPSMPSLPITTAHAADSDSTAVDSTSAVINELYAMPHQLGHDNSDAYEHPHPQMLSCDRPNIILFVLPGLSSSHCRILSPDANSRVMPFFCKMYDSGIGFTQFYANSSKVGDVSTILPLSILKDNGYVTEVLDGSKAPVTPDHILFRNLYDRIEQDRNSGIGRTGKPFCKVVLAASGLNPDDVDYHKYSDSRSNAVAYTDACIAAFMRRLWSTPSWHNTLIICMGAPDPLIKGGSAEHYHVPMFWSGGAVSTRGHVGIMCQRSDLAATLLGQMGIKHKAIPLSNNIFDRSVPHFAFFSDGKSFGFLTDSISYIQHQDGTSQGTNRAKRFALALQENKKKP